MNHIAIDLGGIKSQLCARDPGGTILWEKSVRTQEIPEFLRSEPRSRVVMETCSESYAIANAAIAAHHEVGIVPATLVRELGVGHRGIKTDIRDARALSSASCRVESLPFVHIRSAQSRDRLKFLRARDNLVTARTQLINNVRGTLREELLRVKATSETFPANVRLALENAPCGLPSFVEHVLAAIEALNEQILALTREIEELCARDEDCKRLRTITGVGPMTSLAFVSVVDGVQRFETASGLESYLGLTAGERSSSSKIRRTGITKAGPTIVRQYLTQAALTLWRARPDDPICQWAERVKIRRGKQVAIIALARKLAGVMYAMLKNSEPYLPHKAAAPKSLPEAAMV